MWKKIVGASSMDGLVRRPDLLSFYVASKMPVSVSTRQELLEIDGISYRLQREIELLESVNLIRCKHCQVINVLALFKPLPSLSVFVFVCLLLLNGYAVAQCD